MKHLKPCSRLEILRLSPFLRNATRTDTLRERHAKALQECLRRRYAPLRFVCLWLTPRLTANGTLREQNDKVFFKNWDAPCPSVVYFYCPNRFN
ncbi:hypothetical protein NIES4073_13800 [Kalymmatonema gypsitolerans NIES-4073]|nr:hypothetical protein NIES4073_13800 [Scytonema sp. NIES-4073]